jgi:hypothetical protein
MQAYCYDSLSLDAFFLFSIGLPTTKVNIGWKGIVDTHLITQVINSMSRNVAIPNFGDRNHVSTDERL